MNGSGNDHEDLLSKNDIKSEETHQSYLTPQLHELERMEVPKCLGDIFDSVAGAVFLDSDNLLIQYEECIIDL
jgi:dsRNA-specific ribonuclease